MRGDFFRRHLFAKEGLEDFSGRMPADLMFVVALALHEQLLEAGEVPVTESDFPVDVVVTGSGQTLTRPGAAFSPS